MINKNSIYNIKKKIKVEKLFIPKDIFVYCSMTQKSSYSIVCLPQTRIPARFKEFKSFFYGF